MSPRADIALLRRVANGIETAADRLALAERVRGYLDGAPAGASLDAVFGLAPAAGQLPWWRAEALSIRDAALRALASRHYGGRPVARQASAIRAALLAYATTSWRFDRDSLSMPPRYVGTEREMLFDALKAVDTVPSADRIRRLLSGR